MRHPLPALVLSTLLVVATAACGTEPPAQAAAAPAPAAAPQVPLEVDRAEGQVSVQVLVTLPDGKAYPFAVDTGAQVSSIEAGLAERLRLPVKGEFLLRGVTGTERTQLVGIEGWRLGDVPLPAGRAVLTRLPADADPQERRLMGLLGSDVLSTFGSVTLDYDGGRLVLGGQ